MRRFALYTFFGCLLIFWWSRFVSSGQLLAKLDAKPHRRGTATVLYTVGRYYDVMNNNRNALKYYERIVERYPKSRYGMEASFGVALCHERLKDFKKALEEYVVFVEKYPDSKYSTSVRNNIEILRSR
jgi:outer membrane protein assembly factor BamD (BamD/ComL family)